MSQSIVQIDAFTDRPFAGNPAAVCLVDSAADEKWMQNVATEMNLSETAFLYREGSVYNLRWFTPAAEVEMCGHATLASAHLLFTDGIEPADKEICFKTLSGELFASNSGDWITLNFPALYAEQCDPPVGLVKALGVNAIYVGKSKFDYLVELESEEAVRKLQPDLATLASYDARGVAVTAKGDGEFDMVSRYFAPAFGIDEDPVTGSTHCLLATYWKKRLNKTELNAYQASKRGGVVRIRLEDDRVHLSGQAVITMRGELV